MSQGMKVKVELEMFATAGMQLLFHVPGLWPVRPCMARTEVTL